MIFVQIYMSAQSLPNMSNISGASLSFSSEKNPICERISMICMRFKHKICIHKQTELSSLIPCYASVTSEKNNKSMNVIIIKSNHGSRGNRCKNIRRAANENNNRISGVSLYTVKRSFQNYKTFSR